MALKAPQRHLPVAKKVGYRPSAFVLRELARKHPTVRLMWEKNYRRWVITERFGGRINVLYALADKDGGYVRPTIANTVHYLDSIDPRKLKSKYAINEFLQGLEDTDTAAKRLVDEKHHDRVQEGHDRMFREIIRPTFVVPKPSETPA
jgi:hypothetical protein